MSMTPIFAARHGKVFWGCTPLAQDQIERIEAIISAETGKDALAVHLDLALACGQAAAQRIDKMSARELSPTTVRGRPRALALIQQETR
jgi:hypothetical protein